MTLDNPDPDINRAQNFNCINKKFQNKMLIYNIDNQFAHEEFNHYNAAGVASFIVKFSTQPMEILKIRFQLQHEPINGTGSKSKYKSISQAVRLIYKEEGILAFWKGIWLCQLITIVYNVSQFYTFDKTSAYFHKKNILRDWPNLQNFICGGLSGCSGISIIMPLDVVKTRIIAQDRHSGYHSTFEAIRLIFQKEGVRGLYRGMSSSYLQTMPLIGSTFMFYCFFGNMASRFLNLKSRDRLPSWTSLILGGLSGTLAKAIIYPLDLVEKRLQIQGFADNRKTFGKFIECTNIRDCLINTVKAEGIGGIYKGLIPAMVKCAWTTALTFYFYNFIVRLTSENPNIVISDELENPKKKTE